MNGKATRSELDNLHSNRSSINNRFILSGDANCLMQEKVRYLLVNPEK